MIENKFKKKNFIAEKTVSVFNVNVQVILACFLTLQLKSEKSYVVVKINSGIPPGWPANIDRPAD